MKTELTENEKIAREISKVDSGALYFAMGNEKSLEEKQRVLIDKETNLDQLSKQKALKMMEEMLEKSKPCNWQLSETEEKMKKYMQAIPVYQDPYHTNEWEKFVDINEENNKTARKDLERFRNYDFDL